MPIIQLRLGILVVAMMALLLVIVLTFTYLFLNEFTDMLVKFTDTPASVIQQARYELARLFKFLCVLGVMIFSATLVLIIVETHKIVGAAYAINKFVKENLLNNVYDKKIHLRKGDHFQDLAENINELSERLNKQKK